MLIEFCVENFRSYKGLECLNLQAAAIDELENINVISLGKYRLLKSKIIYGANASGKSNLIKALYTFLDIISDSVKNENVLEQIEPFMFFKHSAKKPSYFQMMFLMDGVFYRYGFEADNQTIHSEWLFGAPAGREVPFFIREGQKIHSFSIKYFKEGKKLYELFKEGNEIFRKNSLFLTSVAAMNGQLANRLRDYFKNIIIIGGIDDPRLLGLAMYRIDKANEKDKFLKFLKYADITIRDLKIVREADTKRLLAVFDRFDQNGELKDSVELDFFKTQSKGTIKLLELTPILLDSLKQNRILIVDEFDARLHPIIAKEILKMYNSVENKCAQIVSIAHCTSLMDKNILRRDQIDFVDKDKFGASHIYNLAEFKGVRKNVPFEKYYLSGQFSAVPKTKLKNLLYEQTSL